MYCPEAPPSLPKYTNVSVNSKPDHPPGQNPQAIFWWANSPPPGQERSSKPHPQAYKNELKPHPWGIFLNYSL